jgi:4-amino-4-deoxy-L-arabinose transferase-like glycosyltransferase
MTKTKLVPLIILSLLTLVLFFFLRLSNLNGIPVFVDEGIYVRWSQVMKNEPNLRFIPQTDGKQPLSMWSTIPFFKITKDPLIAGRLVSVASGFGSLFAIAFLSYVLFGNFLVAIVSSLLYTLVPYTVFFDRMALADSMLSMFGIWTIGLGVLFAKTQRLDHAMLLGFAVGGGLLTKSPAIFFYPWIFLALVFFFRPAKKVKLQSLVKVFTGLFSVLVISQLMYGVLRLGPAFEMIGARNQDYLFTWKEVLSHPLNPLTGNLKTTINWLWLLLTPTILVALFLGFVSKKSRVSALFLIIVSLLPLFTQAAIAKVYTSRYILFGVTPLLPIASLGLYWLSTRRGKLIKLSTIVILIVPLFISILCVFSPTKAPLSFDMRNGYLEEWTAGWGQKDIANYFIDLEAQGEKVVAFTEGYFGTLPDGLQIYTNNHPNITIVGSSPYVGSIPEGLIDTDSKNQRFLILNKSRNHLNAGHLNDLHLVKEYVKPSRLDGSSEVLQLYRYLPNSL